MQFKKFQHTTSEVLNIRIKPGIKVAQIYGYIVENQPKKMQPTLKNIV